MEAECINKQINYAKLEEELDKLQAVSKTNLEVSVKTEAEDNGSQFVNLNKGELVIDLENLIENNEYQHFSWIYRYVEQCKTKKICSVCLDDNEELLNRVMECRNCRHKVHQNCYIRTTYGKKNFLNFQCEKCTSKVDFRIPCKFCNVSEGIMISIKGKEWAHIACIKWIFQIEPFEIDNDFDFNKVLPEWRTMNRCDICRFTLKENNNLCVLKCAQSGCYFYMHVSCALKENLIFRSSEMEKSLRHLFKNWQCINPFCPDHLLHHLEMKSQVKIEQTLKDVTNNINTKSFTQQKDDELSQAEDIILKFLLSDVERIKRDQDIMANLNLKTFTKLADISYLFNRYYLNMKQEKMTIHIDQ